MAENDNEIWVRITKDHSTGLYGLQVKEGDNFRWVTEAKYDWIADGGWRVDGDGNITRIMISDPKSAGSTLYVKVDNKIGAINYKGEEVIPLIYDRIDSLYDPENRNYGNFEVCLQGNDSITTDLKLLHTEGSEPCLVSGAITIYTENAYAKKVWQHNNAKVEIYDSIVDGMFRFCENDKWGMMDISFRQVITPKYDWVSRFKEGLAIVQNGNLFGYLNKQGKTVIDCRYVKATYFGKYIEGLAVVSVNTGGKYKLGMIDKYGRVVVGFEFDEISDSGYGYPIIAKNGLFKKKKYKVDKYGNLESFNQL